MKLSATTPSPQKAAVRLRALRKHVELVRRLDAMGYRGDYSFEVFNDDYVQMPLALVAQRAKRSVQWITDHVSRRSLPVRRHVS